MLKEINQVASVLLKNCRLKYSPKNIIFKCVHSFCGQQIFKTRKEISSHWTKDHEFVPDKSDISPMQLPFAFCLQKLVRCLICKNRIDTLKQIGLHHYNSHGNSHGDHSFATIDPSNTKQCGECMFRFKKEDRLLEHYRTEHPHKMLYRIEEGPLKITNAMLKQFGNVDAFTSPIVYCCSYENCRKYMTDELKMAEHIRSHEPEYKCKFCSDYFHLQILVTAHQKLKHIDDVADDSLEYGLINLERRGIRFRQMRLVLPNGFSFTKEEGADTIYGDMKAIFAHMLRFYRDELEAYTKDSTTTVNKVSDVPKTDDKIKLSVTSEAADSTSKTSKLSATSKSINSNSADSASNRAGTSKQPIHKKSKGSKSSRMFSTKKQKVADSTSDVSKTTRQREYNFRNRSKKSIVSNSCDSDSSTNELFGEYPDSDEEYV